MWAAYATHNAAIGVPDLPQARIAARSRCGRPRRRWDPAGPGQPRTRRGHDLGNRRRVRHHAHRPRPPQHHARQERDPLSAREQELVTLVAQGRTDTQIAAQLYISVRTVRSHLDRIRDKSGCRRRADLTRLALQAGLV